MNDSDDGRMKRVETRLCKLMEHMGVDPRDVDGVLEVVDGVIVAPSMHVALSACVTAAHAHFDPDDDGEMTIDVVLKSNPNLVLVTLTL